TSVILSLCRFPRRQYLLHERFPAVGHRWTRETVRNFRAIWPHYQMKVAGVKSVHDAAAWLVQQGRFFTYGPVARKTPIVKIQMFGSRVDARFVPSSTQRKVLSTLIPEVVLS